MRYLAIASFLAILTSACTETVSKSEYEKLKEQQQEMLQQSSEKDSMIYDYVTSLNEVQENLARIREAEKSLTINLKGVEGKKDRQSITNELQIIDSLMKANRANMSTLETKYANAKYKITEFEKFIASLQERVAAKDGEIVELRKELASANAQYADLFDQYLNVEYENSILTDDAATAYYTLGTKKELKENNVISGKGLFNTSKELKNDFNNEYFQQIDIRFITEIDLSAKDAKLVTNHPTDSYEMTKEADLFKQLKITDPVKFWSVSKYLVIMVD